MNLIKTSLLSLISTSVKMLAGFAISKAVAVAGGPSGLALVGQFQNFVQVALTVAKGGFDTGITKYVAEFGDNEAQQGRLLATAARLSAGTGITVASVLIIAAGPLSRYFLLTRDYAYVIRLFGGTVCLFVLNSYLLAVINGLRQVRIFVLVNITQSVVTLALTLALIAWLGLAGALIALATNQSLVLIVALWALRHDALLRWRQIRRGFNRRDAGRLLRFSLMTTVSAIAAPLAAMAVRGQVLMVLGADAAGCWQAMWFVASVYLTMVTTSLSVYYLPKLSAIVDPALLRAELANGFKIVMPIVIASALALYVARGLVVHLLFTDAFRPMLRLFAWVLIGDVIKMGSWLLSYLMLAKAMVRAFIATEIVFSASFIALVSWLIRWYGLEGAAYAYAANYVFYLAAVAALTRRSWLPDHR